MIAGSVTAGALVGMASIAGLTAFDAWSIRFALFVFGWAGLFFVIVAVIYILATRPPSSTTVTVLIAIIGVTSVVFLVPAQHILDPCRRAGSIGSPSGGETHQPQTFPVTGTSQVGEFLWLGTRLVDGPGASEADRRRHGERLAVRAELHTRYGNLVN
jgi:hypothetical protein